MATSKDHLKQMAITNAKKFLKTCPRELLVDKYKTADHAMRSGMKFDPTVLHIGTFNKMRVAHLKEVGLQDKSESGARSSSRKGGEPRFRGARPVASEDHIANVKAAVQELGAQIVQGIVLGCSNL